MLAGITACGGGGASVTSSTSSSLPAQTLSSVSVGSRKTDSTMQGASSYTLAPSAPGGGAVRFGQEPPNYDPPANWRPYAPNSTWNQALSNPDRPPLDANSQAMISAMFNPAFGSNQYQGRVGVPYGSAIAQGQGTGGFPFYFAQSSDPLVTINCTAGYGTCPMQGKKYNVPSRALAASNSDRHMVVIQPDGIELDVWEWGVNFNGGGTQNPPWYGGETVNVGWGGLANVTTGTGWDEGGDGSTASGSDGLAGTIREPEIAAGVIAHALSATVYCSPTATPVYPATHSTAQTSCNGFKMQPNQIIAAGNRLWIDLTDAQINGLSQFTLAQRTILHALHDYGAFITDTSGYSPLGIDGVESQAPGYAYGNDIVGAWAAKNLPFWYGQSGVNWYDSFTANQITQTIQPHLHVLAPCVNNGYPGGKC
jgi:hypothetical protein